MSTPDSTTTADAAPAEPEGSSRRLIVMVLLLIVVAGGWVGFSAYQKAISPEGYFAEAHAALQKNELDRVVVALDHLTQFDNYAAHCHYLRGALLLRDGKLDVALGELQYALFHPDVEVEAHVLTGQALYQMGRAREALRHWSLALTIDENSEPAHRWMAVYYYDIGAMHEAVHHLKAVSMLNLDDARSLRLMGMIHHDYDQFSEAVENFRESLRRDENQPDRNDILTEYAECQMELRQYEAALELLAKADPSAKVLVLTAKCHLNLGDTEKALQQTEEALALDNSNADAFLLKGRLLLEANDAGAVAPLKLAALLEPKNFEVQFQLAQALRLAGQMEEAEAVNKLANELRDKFERFSQLNQQAVDDRANAELRVEIGELAVELGRGDLAREWFRAALYLDPTNEKAFRNLEALNSVRQPPPTSNQPTGNQPAANRPMPGQPPSAGPSPAGPPQPPSNSGR